MSGALVVMSAGLVRLTGLTTYSSIARLVPGLVVAGVGSGFLKAALGRESVASAPAGQGGLGSGANHTARYLGSALGVTVMSVVTAPPGTPAPAALVAGWNHAALATAAVSLVGALGLVLVGGFAVAPEPAEEIRSRQEADAA